MFNPAGLIGTNMANILGSRFNSDAIAFASGYGLSLDTKPLTEQQKQRMRNARIQSLADNLTLGQDAGVRDNAITQVMQAAAGAAPDLANSLGGAALFNGKDRKWYFRETGTNPTANWTQVRKRFANQPMFFDYRWRIVINYNKLAGAVSSGAKIASKGWTPQDVMNQRAKSAWKGLLKKAATGFNIGAASSQAQAKAQRRIQDKYDNMASAIGFIRSAANSGTPQATFVQRPQVGITQFEQRFGGLRGTGSGAGLSTQASTPAFFDLLNGNTS